MKNMAGVCLAVSLVASGVSAYEVNKTSSGAEIKWQSKRESIVVNIDGGPSGFLSAVQNAMQTWNNGGASFVFSYGGASDSHDYGVYDSINLVDIGYLKSGVIGQNKIWYSTVSSGYLLETDIRFNSAYYSWATDGSGSKYDVQNVATHEMGHSLSLGDLYSESDKEKTMYGYTAEGETKKRSLDPDDADGIRYLYPMVVDVDPSIYINGMQGSVSLDAGDAVRIDVSLVVNEGAGINQDWWAVVSTPFGWYFLNSIGQWVSTPNLSYLYPAYQGPAGNISYCQILSMPSLPLGTYTFYFGLDTMNGILDSSIMYDAATLTVIPPLLAPTGISASDGTYTTNKVWVTHGYQELSSGFDCPEHQPAKE